MLRERSSCQLCMICNFANFIGLSGYYLEVSTWSLLDVLVCQPTNSTVSTPALSAVPKSIWGTEAGNQSGMMKMEKDACLQSQKDNWESGPAQQLRRKYSMRMGKQEGRMPLYDFRLISVVDISLSRALYFDIHQSWKISILDNLLFLWPTEPDLRLLILLLFITIFTKEAWWALLIFYQC